MHPDWLSNAYLIADEPGGTAVFVDSGAPLERLFEAVDGNGLNVTHLLTTHADHDHIAGEPEGTERCRVSGEEATLIVWSPDYDGKGKAWVRFDDGRDAIIGGSRVEREG